MTVSDYPDSGAGPVAASLDPGSGTIPLAGATLLYNNATTSQAPGTPGLLGATIGPKNYPTLTQAQSNTTFDGYVARPMAITAQKFYQTEANYSTTSTAVLNALASSAQGAFLLLCLKPSRTLTPAEQANLANYLAFWTSHTTNYDCVLWQEANDADNNGVPFFPNAAAYAAYVAYYKPTVNAAAHKNYYDPTLSPNVPNDAVAFYPGDANVDAGIICDYYGNNFRAGSTLDGLAALADNHLPAAIPFGIGEWNAHVFTSPVLTLAQWQDYVNYIITFFQARLAAGKTNGPVMMYMGDVAATNPQNQVLSGTDFKIPLIRKLYDSLASGPGTIQGTVIPPGVTKVIAPLLPSPGAGYGIADGLSYDISLIAQAGAASTAPWATVQLTWRDIDATGSVIVDGQAWDIPMGTNGAVDPWGNQGALTFGSGPQEGQFLMVQITNHDTVSCNVVCQVNWSGRSQARHKWLWDAVNSVTIPGYTTSNFAKWRNSPGMVGQASIAASTSISRLLSMYAGSVWCRFASSSAQVSVTLQPQPASVWGQPSTIIWSAGNTTPPAIVPFPRAPVLVTITNNDAGAPHDGFFQAVALD